jgi:ABC-type transport system involved in multi-copper enzyme maturation permease subunit
MRDVEKPVPFRLAARGVFDLALEGMMWSRRSVLAALLLALPVGFALLYRLVLVSHVPPQTSPFQFYGFLVALYYVRNVLPLVALFYASSLVADEVEGKTITYLLTRPIPRAAVVAGKFAAYLVTTLALALPTIGLTFFLLMTTRGWGGLSGVVPDLFRDMGVTALALLAYGALFTLVGVLMRRPTIPGLMFLFGWELLANLPGYLPRFTLTAYLRSLLRHRPAQEGIGSLFGEVLPAGQCLAVLVAVTALLLWASFGIFSRREYVLEQ